MSLGRRVEEDVELASKTVCGGLRGLELEVEEVWHTEYYEVSVPDLH